MTEKTRPRRQRTRSTTEMWRIMQTLTADLAIRLDRGDLWFVSIDAEIPKDGLLHSVTGRGSSPTAAIRDAFEGLTQAERLRDGREVRWNGAAFQDAPRTAQQADLT